MPNPVTSRRAVLTAMAGAAVTLAGRLQGATPQNRALVCVRIANEADTAAILGASSSTATLPITSAQSQQQYALHASLPSVRGLFEQGAVALLQEQAAVADRDYIQGGFSVPAWMVSAAGASVTQSAGRAFPFSSGLVVLDQNSSSFTSGTAEPLDNAAMLAQAATGNFSFPTTAIAQQLRQVAGLLAAGGTSQKMYSVSLGGSATVGDSDAQVAARLAQLDAALAAFYSAVDQLGFGLNVVTFTDSDSATSAPRPALRLVMGRSVLGGEVYSPAVQENPSAALAAWGGYSFTGSPTAAPAAPFLY